MEALSSNQLMIGDWVINTEFDKNEISQIEIVEPNRVWLKDGKLYIPIYYIKPIPLTPEILEKNGFYYDEDRKVYIMGVIFQVKPERYGLFSLKICGCLYPLSDVHQLQHALKLCGIDKEIEL